MKRSFIILFTLLVCYANAQTYNASRYPVVPKPQMLKPADGYFTFSAKENITFDAALQPAANLLSQIGGFMMAPESKGQKNRVKFSIDESIKEDEGYKLSVKKDAISVKAKNLKGAFCAVATLRQLLYAGGNSGKTVACVEIEDFPRFAYRGMHIDVSRHFFSKEFVKKYLDLLSYYKFNRMHFHLTDDQGWRIEIKKYPALTEQGAFREFNDQDSVCIKQSKDNPDMAIDPQFIVQRNGKTMYGGYYTQDDIREIVAYAKARGIEILPEIDMPGHMMAAIKNYPFLSCSGSTGWGKEFSTPICPCSETTYEFAQNVYKEVMELFPYEYVHLGADEVEKTSWKNDACKTFMEKEGLKNVEELQSYFVRRMEKFFNANGRKLIGWDEILEGGVSPTATIMYWRSWVKNAHSKAAKLGNKVIMTPVSHCYFDYAPDKNTIENVYKFNPIPEGLTEKEAANIIGVQANVWAEWIANEKRWEYQVYPRMLSLAEVAWGTNNDFSGYKQRLQEQLKYLDTRKVAYRLPDLGGFTDYMVFTDKQDIVVDNPDPESVVHYTTDGSIPAATSPVLPKPFTVDKSETIKLTAYRKDGRHGDIYTIKLDKQAYAKSIILSQKPELGLKCNYYPGDFKGTTYITEDKLKNSFITTGINVPAEANNAPAFGLKYTGYLEVPESGVYTFYLTSDDGSVLKIAGRMVVDNDGLHSSKEKSGQVALEKGYQKFELDFIEGGGGYTLKLLWGKAGETMKEIDARLLSH